MQPRAHPRVVPEVPSVVTRQTVFSLCGQLVGHLPVCSWLRVARRIHKRRASSVTKGWDNEAREIILQLMMSETIGSVLQDDPACGDWCVDSKELNIWVDASSLAIGVASEWRKTMLEDACWLRPEADGTHQLSRTRRCIERHQFSSPVAGQGATCKDGFCVRVSLDIEHTDWKSACPH